MRGREGARRLNGETDPRSFRVARRRRRGWRGCPVVDGRPGRLALLVAGFAGTFAGIKETVAKREMR
jgi:hypothetical protein